MSQWTFSAYEPLRHHVWVPAGDTGSVDVIDAETRTLTRISGFATASVERNGKQRTVGPSSATVGDDAVYVGNRADSSVCRVDARTLKPGECVRLDIAPDGLAYVAGRHEVWVTSPRDKSIRILDVALGPLAQRAKLDFEAAPEGFAVDEGRGLFFTNLPEKDLTLAIDLVTRKNVSVWPTHCGEDGAKGLALDRELNFLFVACEHEVAVLDAGHEGRLLSKLETGAGLDNIDYVQSRHEVFAAAARVATLTVARLERTGQLVPLAVETTAQGSRTVVATESGLAFVTDGAGGRILVIDRPKR